jgi:hypothetical protein
MPSLDDAAEQPSPREVPERPSRARHLIEVASPAVCYLLLAFLVFRPLALLEPHRLPGCACGDPEQQAWFLAWVSFALTHGLNPLFTHYLNVPTGANLAIDTSMPLLGVLGMPVTLLAGPVATYNLLLRLGLAASGTSMFFVLRRYVSWWPAAFGGGLLFAFSPYMVGQSRRHLFLVFLPLLPLLIPLLDDWLVGMRMTAIRSGILVGLVAGLQFLISPEVLVTSIMLAAVALLFLALRHRAAVRQRVAAAIRGLAAAVPVFALIAGYAVWMLLAGPNRPIGPLHNLSDLSRYHGDLLAAVVPTGNELFDLGGLSRIGGSLVAGSRTENGFYLGIPLLALLCYLAVRFRRTGIVAVSVVVGVVAFVLSLGQKLTADGRVLFAPMPFALFVHLPVLQDLEAARLSLFVQMTAAIIFAVGLDRVRASGWGISASGRAPASQPEAERAAAAEPRSTVRASPLVVAAVGLVALIPLVPNVPFRTHAVTAPKFFTTRAVHLLPRDALALTFPFDRAPHNEPMVWQWSSGMRFRMLGGDVFVPGPGRRSTWKPSPPGPRVLSAVLLPSNGHRPPAGEKAVAAIRLLCAGHHVDVVLVQPTAPDGHALASLVGLALRAPPRHLGQMDVWLDVQRDLALGQAGRVARTGGGAAAPGRAATFGKSLLIREP